MRALFVAGLLFLPQVKGGSAELPPAAGAFNVRDYGAKGDGKTDDTEAIRKAFSAVKRHYQLLYIPDGTYLLSDTISWKNFLVVQGQSQTGTILRLKDECPGYTDPAKPKAVVRCLYNNNESIGNYLSHLTVDTGKGNVGAIGLRYNAHNQGICERVTVRSGDGKGKIGLDLSESEFGPAWITQVTVDGFDVGIKTPGAPSHATMESITLRNQGVAGIENHFPVSIRKLSSTNAVPAIVNRGGCLTQLVLLDSKLTGGSKTAAAIDSENAALYLRGVTTSGYQAALKDQGKVVPGPVIAEYITGETYGQPKGLNLPIEDAPEPFAEPASKWLVVDNTGDCTKAIQSAIDSGATTLFFKPVEYRVSDTIHVRGKVRRILGAREATLRGEQKDFGLKKPMLRFDGSAKEPVTVEHLGLSTWPHPLYAMELATAQTVHLKGVYAASYIELRNTPEATGKLFLTEAIYPVKLDHPQNVWIRHFNVENNPFDANKPLPTYLVNRGGTVWILGMKTESPAYHVITSNGGRTEILGGFFRDHFSNTGTPYFTTQDGTLAATYTQYAWAPGKSRDLQGVETRSGETKELRLSPDNHVIGLYSVGGSGAKGK
jgi:hypothetical protein